MDLLYWSATLWRNGSDSRALAYYTLANKQVVTGSIPGVPHILGLYWYLLLPAWLRNQTSISRMCVQAYMRVKWVAVSVHSETWARIKFGIHFPQSSLANKIVRLQKINAQNGPMARFMQNYPVYLHIFYQLDLMLIPF